LKHVKVLEGAQTDHLVAVDWLIDWFGWLTGFEGGVETALLPLGNGTATTTVMARERMEMKLVSCMMKLRKGCIPVCEAWECSWLVLCCAVMIFQQVRAPVLIGVCYG
jgi:hypothetical protein